MSWNNGKHAEYDQQDWSKIPSIFAESVVELFPDSGKILEIGAGLGQDSRFFCDFGLEVLSTDFSIQATELNQERGQKQIQSGKYRVDLLDITNGTSYTDNEFDVVYAHLSLHYFSELQTKNIVTEVLRILKKGGIFAILLNTINDPEYGKGEEIENDFFMISGISKRYFSVDSARKLFGEGFEVLLLDNQGETYKDEQKGIHNLIRFVGKKI